MFLMPCEPGNPRKIDAAWMRERDILRELGEGIALFDHDALEHGDIAEALKRTNFSHGAEKVIYRGWMTAAENYAALYSVLLERGITLLDNAHAYSFCHHAPEQTEALTPWMSRTDILPIEQFAEMEAFLGELPQTPVVIKDWVKSEAGMWNEACYIPNPHDTQHALKVIERFIELRGNGLTGGIVFREYVELDKDSSGRPAEFRAFIVDGKQAGSFIRRNGPDSEPPPESLCADLASCVAARFFTADFARKIDGDWLLLEAGYGGVSGIPDHADPTPVLLAVAEAAHSPLKDINAKAFKVIAELRKT